MILLIGFDWRLINLKVIEEFSGEGWFNISLFKKYLSWFDIFVKWICGILKVDLMI